jgi:putative SOS response-associated peptidase YedK
MLYAGQSHDALPGSHPWRTFHRICNLYNITTSQDATCEWTRAMRDIMGNLEPSLDVYPNMPGAVVRNAPDGQRELAKLEGGAR